MDKVQNKPNSSVQVFTASGCEEIHFHTFSAAYTNLNPLKHNGKYTYNLL
jgi:hypothetical protein